MKIMTIKEVEEYLEGVTGFSCFGFRGATKKDLDIIKIAKMKNDCYLNASLDLCGRRDCDYDANADKLDGTSAIPVNEFMFKDELIDRYDYAFGYAYNHHKTDTVLLIAGDFSEDGEDFNETIIRADFCEGAKVIAIIRR